MIHSEALVRIPQYQALLQKAVDENPAFPAAQFSGRGIVICGGGPKYLPPAWVCISMLRQHGCTLPIELWHLGPAEMPVRFKELVEPLGVRCVDGLVGREECAGRRFRGWELKCHAILHSAFEHVILLDADNVPLRDPEFLFETAEYHEHGALFWPDFGRLAKDREIWKICDIEYRDEAEFESGQIVVDKSRCWRALHLANHFNAHSEFYFLFVHGDKETFHLAWRKLGQSYHMTKRPVGWIRHTMVQHDFAGQRLFLHRNFDKWALTRENERVPGFNGEDDCLRHLRDLALRWHRHTPGISQWAVPGKSEALQRVAEELVATCFVYHRIGHDFRAMSFRADGRVGLGAGGCEVTWDLREDAEGIALHLYGLDALSAVCRRAWDGSWRGMWLRFEKMPIELTPQPTRTGRAPASEGHTFEFARTMPRLIHQIWLGPRPIGAQEKEWAKTWRRLHPSWHYQLWTDAEVADLSLKNRALFDTAKSPAMKADILRYELLHRFGGVYADLDFECLHALDDLLREVDSTAFAGFEWPTVTHRFSVCNALLGALPGAPLLEHLIDALPANAERHFGEKDWHRGELIPRSTGPAFLTRCVAEHGECTVFEQPRLYPKAHEVDAATARHHFKGTWKTVVR